MHQRLFAALILIIKSPHLALQPRGVVDKQKCITSILDSGVSPNSCDWVWCCPRSKSLETNWTVAQELTTKKHGFFFWLVVSNILYFP